VYPTLPYPYIIGTLSYFPKQILPTNPSYIGNNPEDNLSNFSAYDRQDQQYRPQDFISFPISMPDPMPGETSFSSGNIPYPTNMAGLPIFSETVQWEWDLQNLWNGYLMPES
jgi:hypothetical protein